MKAPIAILEKSLGLLGMLQAKCREWTIYIDNLKEYLEARQRIGKYFRYVDTRNHDGDPVFSHVILCHVTGMSRSMQERHWDDAPKQEIQQSGIYLSYFEQNGIRSRCDEVGEDSRGLVESYRGMEEQTSEITKEEFLQEVEAFKNYPTVQEYVAQRDSTKKEQNESNSRR